MPLAGAVGAITAANRSSRNRRTTGTCRQSVPVKFATPAATKQANQARPDFVFHPQQRDTTETASVDSKTSILSMFKQKAEETSCFFKKQKDALAEKVQKGMKMTSNMTPSGQRKGTEERAKPSNPQKNVGLDPAWMEQLEQMGFEASKVHEAVAMVGGQPEQMDDLLQVLVSMHASSVSTTSASAAPTKPAPTATAAPQLSRPQVTHKEPPLPSMCAVGSAEFEMSSDRRSAAQVTRSAAKSQMHSPSAVQSLEQMGFQQKSIHMAIARLPPNAAFEELFNLLLAMGAPHSPPNSGNTGSSGGPASAGFTGCPTAERVKLSLQTESMEQASEMSDLDVDRVSSETAQALVAAVMEGVVEANPQATLESSASVEDATGRHTPELVLETEPLSPSSWSDGIALPAGILLHEPKVEACEQEPSVREVAKSTLQDVYFTVCNRTLSQQSQRFKSKLMDGEPRFASPVKGGA
jgi:Holliday junction resolvasome RuvABC DNA-binding subunit